MFCIWCFTLNFSSAVLGFGGFYHPLIGSDTLEESFPFFGYVWNDENRWRQDNLLAFRFVMTIRSINALLLNVLLNRKKHSIRFAAQAYI